jgi:large subunit ribosomal protein L24
VGISKYKKTAGAKNRLRHQRAADRVRLHVSKGDQVRVMRGDDRGKEGKVLRVFPKTGRAVVEGVNIVKKHRRARKPEEKSEIVELPAPVHASKLMLLDPKSGEPTRVRMRIDSDGTKERLDVKSGDSIPPARREP